MSKEYTIFVLDASKSMDVKSDGETKSDFERALQYTFGYFTQQLIKNRKSDRFALILYSGSTFEVLYDNSVLTYSVVQTYYTDSIEFHKRHTNDAEKVDLIDALYQALNLFSSTIKLKFVRNLYLLTNGVLPVGTIDRILLFQQMIKEYEINTTLSLIANANRNNQSTNSILTTLTKQFINTKFIDFDRMISLSQPPKLVSPRCIAEGCLGFGILDGLIDQVGTGIHFQVQVFPGVKASNPTSSTSYYIDPILNQPNKVDTALLLYIKKTSDLGDDEDAEDAEDGDESNSKETETQGKSEEEKISVTWADCTPGFKYSHRDLLAITPELEAATTLETSPSLDILGFYEKHKFPYAYMTEESTYVIPHQQYHEGNRLGYNSLIRAMIDLNYVALVRFVAKQDAEVQVCVAFPRYVAIGKQQGCILVLVRVAMKEDEKIGHFPKLEETNDRTVDDLMELYIKSKKLRRDRNFNPYILDDSRITLTHSEPVSEPTSADSTIDRILLARNPATDRFNYYFKKILFESLALSDPLSKFLQEEKFVSKYLSAGEKNTLFNMDTILGTPEKFLYTNEYVDAGDIANQLQAKLDTRYILQSKQEKKKRVYDTAFGSQSNDGKFDEFFDVEDLLAG